jgi:hypothetical protein
MRNPMCAWRKFSHRRMVPLHHATEDGESRRHPMLAVARSYRRTTFVLALLSFALLMALAALRE